LVSSKSLYLRPSDNHLVSSKSLILRPSDNHFGIFNVPLFTAF
jgi:hypothetical protein